MSSSRAPTALICIALFLSGCSYFASASIPVRAFLTPEMEPDPELGAWGYVLLTVRPVRGEDDPAYERSIATADAYLAALEEAVGFPDVPPSELMFTYWPVRTDLPPEAETSRMVNEFDFARSEIIWRELREHEEIESDTRGPVLVALTQDENEGMLVWDLGSIEEENLRPAFREWKNRISQDPSNWENGFALDKIRWMISQNLNLHGKAILSLIPWN